MFLGKGPRIVLRSHEAQAPGDNPDAWRWEVSSDEGKFMGSGVAQSFEEATRKARAVATGLWCE